MDQIRGDASISDVAAERGGSLCILCTGVSFQLASSGHKMAPRMR